MSEVRYVKHRSKRKNESEPLQTSENRTDKVGKREKGD